MSEALAKLFATYHHGKLDQRRKYTNEPYIVHPATVADIVRSVAHTEDMLCAAWLHDVLEDTDAKIGDIRLLFGNNVLALVKMLTDVSKKSDGNRAARKKIDKEHLSKASPEAKTIKLADLIDNTNSITTYDKDFAVVYMHEKKDLLEVLREGSSELYSIALKLVEEYEKERGKNAV